MLPKLTVLVDVSLETQGFLVELLVALLCISNLFEDCLILLTSGSVLILKLDGVLLQLFHFQVQLIEVGCYSRVLLL